MGRYEGTDVFLGRRDHGSCHSAVADVKGELPLTGIPGYRPRRDRSLQAKYESRNFTVNSLRLEERLYPPFTYGY